MNEDALRAMIRKSVARHLGGVQEPDLSAGALAKADRAPVQHVPLSFLSHASHYRYSVPKSGDACVIEPGVTCNHCGYCESHGH